MLIKSERHVLYLQMLKRIEHITAMGENSCYECSETKNPHKMIAVTDLSLFPLYSRVKPPLCLVTVRPSKRFILSGGDIV